MENINEYIGLIIATVVVVIVVILQITSFIKTKLKISELGNLFNEVESLFLKETSLVPDILKSKSSLQRFLSNIPNRHVKSEIEEERIDYINLSLIAMPEGKKAKGRFCVIINRTNEYLCKNTGTSADLGILESICDNPKNTLEDEIHNSLKFRLSWNFYRNHYRIMGY